MEQKTKVILTYDGDTVDLVLLSDEQLRLLQLLYDENCFESDFDFEIMGKESQFHEV